MLVNNNRSTLPKIKLNSFVFKQKEGEGIFSSFDQQRYDEDNVENNVGSGTITSSNNRGKRMSSSLLHNKILSGVADQTNKRKIVFEPVEPEIDTQPK